MVKILLSSAVIASALLFLARPRLHKRQLPVLSAWLTAATRRPDMPRTARGAVVNAAKEGAPYVEFDVQASSNSVLYAFHDRSLEAKTTGTGSIASRTSTQVNRYRYDNGDPIAHVTDVLAALKPYPATRAFIDIKVPDAQTYKHLRVTVGATSCDMSAEPSRRGQFLPRHARQVREGQRPTRRPP